jgi:hypothetical protein
MTCRLAGMKTGEKLKDKAKQTMQTERAKQ